MQQTQSPTSSSTDTNLARDLANLLNRYSAENGSNTPDFLLAEYLLQGLALLNKTVQARAKWYGRMDTPGQSGASTDAETLWKLLDDIDTADDQFKPLDGEPARRMEALLRFRELVMQKVGQRHAVLTSDGYRLRPRIPDGEAYVTIPAHELSLDKLATSDISRERLVALLRADQAERDRLVSENLRLDSELTKALICIETAIEEGRPPNRPMSGSGSAPGQGGGANHVSDIDIERHAREALAELGVLDPTTDLLRAQLMLEHAKNAHVFAVKLGVADKVVAFTGAEEAAAASRNRLLAETPMGASFADPGILASMARDAVKEVGRATMVTVDANTIDSRYVQYLLRCPAPKPPGGDYRHGLAVVKAVWANGRQHVFPRQILIAAGDGLKDPRRPFDYHDLVRALHGAGLVTNDRLDYVAPEQNEPTSAA